MPYSGIRRAGPASGLTRGSAHKSGSDSMLANGPTFGSSVHGLTYPCTLERKVDLCSWQELPGMCCVAFHILHKALLEVGGKGGTLQPYQLPGLSIVCIVCIRCTNSEGRRSTTTKAGLNCEGNSWFYSRFSCELAETPF